MKEPNEEYSIQEGLTEYFTTPVDDSGANHFEMSEDFNIREAAYPLTPNSVDTIVGEFVRDNDREILDLITKPGSGEIREHSINIALLEKLNLAEIRGSRGSYLVKKPQTPNSTSLDKLTGIETAAVVILNQNIRFDYLPKHSGGTDTRLYLEPLKRYISNNDIASDESEQFHESDADTRQLQSLKELVEDNLIRINNNLSQLKIPADDIQNLPEEVYTGVTKERRQTVIEEVVTKSRSVQDVVKIYELEKAFQYSSRISEYAAEAVDAISGLNLNQEIVESLKPALDEDAILNIHFKGVSRIEPADTKEHYEACIIRLEQTLEHPVNGYEQLEVLKQIVTRGGDANFIGSKVVQIIQDGIEKNRHVITIDKLVTTMSECSWDISKTIDLARDTIANSGLDEFSKAWNLISVAKLANKMNVRNYSNKITDFLIQENPNIYVSAIEFFIEDHDFVNARRFVERLPNKAIQLKMAIKIEAEDSEKTSPMRIKRVNELAHQLISIGDHSAWDGLIGLTQFEINHGLPLTRLDDLNRWTLENGFSNFYLEKEKAQAELIRAHVQHAEFDETTLAVYQKFGNNMSIKSEVVELIRQGKHKKAISFFEKIDQLDEVNLNYAKSAVYKEAIIASLRNGDDIEKLLEQFKLIYDAVSTSTETEHELEYPPYLKLETMIYFAEIACELGEEAIYTDNLNRINNYAKESDTVLTKNLFQDFKALIIRKVENKQVVSEDLNVLKRLVLKSPGLDQTKSLAIDFLQLLEDLEQPPEIIIKTTEELDVLVDRLIRVADENNDVPKSEIDNKAKLTAFRLRARRRSKETSGKLTSSEVRKILMSDSIIDTATAKAIGITHPEHKMPENLPEHIKIANEFGKLINKYPITNNFENEGNKARYIKDLYKIVKKATEPKNQTDYQVQRVLSKELELHDYEVVSNVLMQNISEITNHKLLMRHLNTLLELKNPRAQDLATRLYAGGTLQSEYKRFLERKLIDTGYWSTDMAKVLSDRREKGVTNETIDEILETIINRLNLTPNPEIYQLLEPHNAGVLTGNTVEERAKQINQFKNQFNEIKKLDELHELLKNKEMRLIYYACFAGEYKYRLNNSYTFSKFELILNKVNNLTVSESVMNSFRNALAKGSIPEESINKITISLMSGIPPTLNGETVVTFNSDVEYGGDKERALNRLQKTWRFELDGILNSLYYQEIPDNLEDLESITRPKNTGNGKLSRKIERIRTHLQAGNTPIKVNAIKDIIQTCRLDLMSRTRQRLSGPEKQAELARLESLPYGTVVGEFLEANFESLRDTFLIRELASHINESIEILSAKTTDGKKSSGKVFELTFLNKTEDCIRSLRFADGARCCFNSENYVIQNEVGAADWIARLYKDPLSFVADIKEKDSDEISGFVFGRMGIDISTGLPIVMLNGIYSHYSGDVFVQNVLNIFETHFSQNIGAKSQVIASKHGGQISKPEGYNAKKKHPIRAIRALQDNTGKPEVQVYDDIGATANGDFDFEGYVKELS